MGRKLLRKACAKRLSFPTASRGTKPFLEMCFIKPSLTQSRALRVSRHFDRGDGEAWPGGASSRCVPWPPLSLSSLTLGWCLQLRAQVGCCQYPAEEAHGNHQ